MQKIKLSIFITIIALIFNACSNNDDSTDPAPTAITTNDFTASLDENPMAGTVIGTVSTSTSDGSTLTYSLSNENVAGALALDASTGELTVANASAFDFETNPSITATYTASNGTEEATANITITLNDVQDPFIFTVKPIDGSLFGQPGDFVAFVGGSTQIGTDVLEYDFTIDWGDGSSDHITSAGQAERRHVYPDQNPYQIKITGSKIPHISLVVTPTVAFDYLQSIDQWGDIEWEYFTNSFGYNSNFNILATDTPDLSKVTSMDFMFENCQSFNSGNLGDWDVSNVTNMFGTFKNCTVFNQDIGSWDVSNVITLNEMFLGASEFNQDLNSWTVSNVQAMANVFANARAFNGNITSWDVSGVTSISGMSGMFFNADAFNQDISGWEVRNVRSMNEMFRFNGAFNQNLSGWDVSSVINCSDFAANSVLATGNLPNFPAGCD